MDFTVENMKASDWQQVSQIYLEGINTGIATFQSDIPLWDEWDNGHVDTCRLVAKSGDIVMGWVALSPVSGRCVYAGVAEVSVYIGERYKGMGIGKALLNELIPLSEDNGFWTLQAGIIRENTASRELHKKCGFREIGFRERVGRMPDGKWYDVILMERRSKNGSFFQRGQAFN